MPFTEGNAVVRACELSVENPRYSDCCPPGRSLNTRTISPKHSEWTMIMDDNHPGDKTASLPETVKRSAIRSKWICMLESLG